MDRETERQAVAYIVDLSTALYRAAALIDEVMGIAEGAGISIWEPCFARFGEKRPLPSARAVLLR